jgi:hypothetical protein
MGQMYPFLFKPHGLAAVCTPLTNADQPTVGAHYGVGRIFGSHPPAGILAAYSWMHCFPSANAMWNSVYQAALAGHLDVALPKVKAWIKLHSVQVGKRRLVTSVVASRLEVLEDPFPFADGHTKTIQILPIAGAMPRHKVAPPLFLAREREWALSDREWDAVASIFEGKREISDSLRGALDVVVEKYGAGVPWSVLPSDVHQCSPRNLHAYMIKRNLWGKFVSTVNMMRTADAANVQ